MWGKSVAYLKHLAPGGTKSFNTTQGSDAQNIPLGIQGVSEHEEGTHSLSAPPDSWKP